MSEIRLSEPQERALVDLDAVLHPQGWRRPGGMRGPRTNTLDSLVELGLAERRYRYGSLDWEYRITEKGRSLL